MAEQSKFAGALGRLNKRPAASVKSEAQIDDAPPPPSRAVPEPTGKGARRAGKRSDPEFSPTTFFVRKETKRKAARLLLEDANADKDLSDLVEQLLDKWVSEQTNI